MVSDIDNIIKGIKNKYEKKDNIIKQLKLEIKEKDNTIISLKLKHKECKKNIENLQCNFERFSKDFQSKLNDIINCKSVSEESELEEEYIVNNETTHYYICPDAWCPICEKSFSYNDISDTIVKKQDPRGICYVAICPNSVKEEPHELFVKINNDIVKIHNDKY